MHYWQHEIYFEVLFESACLCESMSATSVDAKHNRSLIRCCRALDRRRPLFDDLPANHSTQIGKGYLQDQCTENTDCCHPDD